MKNQMRKHVTWVAASVALALASLAGTTAANGASFADPTPSPNASESPSAGASGSPDSTQSTPSSPAAPDQSTGRGKSLQAGPPTATTEPTPTPVPTDAPNSPPSNYTPPDGTIFNHPFDNHPTSATYKYAIRYQVLRTIKSVPSGGTIKMAVYSIFDGSTVNALIAARDRGVTVQVIVNAHNLNGKVGSKRSPPSPTFKKLRAALGSTKYRTGMDPERVSWASICSGSCRGSGGNVHYKLFLFSGAGSKQWITMMGSANLTTRAAWGQWNHMNTYTNKAAYDYYSRWFAQMKANSPLKQPYEAGYAGNVWSWTFPKPGTTASTDPLMAALNQVRCKGATGGTGRSGRTLIRIGAYTFMEKRGAWLAKKVRSLWNAGCSISIEYTIMSDPVKKILLSKSGRGRIPAHQIVTTKGGKIDYYYHAKYFAISGVYGSDTSSYTVLTGTTNISDLGFYSDDSSQVYRTKAIYDQYSRDFAAMWNNPRSKTPSPFSSIGVNPAPLLGKGAYANLEDN